MSELSKPNLRGFLVPYPFTIDDLNQTDSTYTIADPVADVPIPERPSGLFVGASGETIQSTDLQIVTSRAGSASTAEYYVRDNTDSTTVDYGCLPSIFLHSFEVLKEKTAVDSYFNSDVIDDGDSGYIAVYEQTAGSKFIRSTIVDAQRNKTTATIAGPFSFATWQKYGKPCIVKMNDGSFIVLVLYTENDKANIRVYRSVDGGENWNLASRDALDTDIDVSSGEYTVYRMSACYKHGQILLVISANTSSSSYTKKNHLLQYASVDGGGTFKLVTKDAELDTNSFRSAVVVELENTFGVAYVADTDEVHFVHVPHAFFSVQLLRTSGQYTKINTGGSSGDFAAGTANNMTSGHVAGHMEANGDIYIYATDVSDNAIVAFYTRNQRDWYSLLTNASTSTQPSVFFADTTEILENYNTCRYYGGSVMVCNSTNISVGDSLLACYFGGFSTISTEYKTVTNIAKQYPIVQGSPTFTYLPILSPAASSELTATGTGTETLDASYFQLELTTSDTQRIYTRTGTLLFRTKSITVFGEVIVDIDDSGRVPAIMQLEVEDSSTSELYKVRVSFYETSVEVHDMVASTQLGTTISWTQGIGIKFMLSINKGKAAFYYAFDDILPLTKYTEHFKNTTISDSSTGSTSQTKMFFGAERSGVGVTSNAKWVKVCVLDANSDADMTNLSSVDLIGKRYSTTTPTDIKNGVRMFSLNGPTYIGDEWTIKTTSDKAIDNIFYQSSSSPRVQWKSATPSTPLSNKTQERIILDLSTNATDLGNDLIGLHLSNLNFRDVKLQYWDGATWQDLADFETSEGMHHGYTRQGRSIKQDATNLHDQRYYFYNELKGFVAMLVSGSTTEFRRVVSNSEGAFGNATGKLCSVLLDEEPTINGDVYFIPIDCTLVANLNGVDASKWALFLPTQRVIDDQFMLGGLHLGAIAITGTQYSKGRTIAIEGGEITTVTPDRTRYSVNIAPEQRTVSLSWSDGVDISAFYNNAPDPDYYMSSNDASAEPVSVYQDVPYMMEGILRELHGGQLPMVYLPSITTSNDTRVYNRRAEHLLGVIDGEVSIQSVTGDELIGDGLGEVMRVGTISIVEVV